MTMIEKCWWWRLEGEDCEVVPTGLREDGGCNTSVWAAAGSGSNHRPAAQIRRLAQTTSHRVGCHTRLLVFLLQHCRHSAHWRSPGTTHYFWTNWTVVWLCQSKALCRQFISNVYQSRRILQTFPCIPIQWRRDQLNHLRTQLTALQFTPPAPLFPTYQTLALSQSQTWTRKWSEPCGSWSTGRPSSLPGSFPFIFGPSPLPLGCA